MACGFGSVLFGKPRTNRTDQSECLKTYFVRFTISLSTSSPGPSPHSKWQIGETPGQGFWNTPRIVEHFVTWHMKWLFWRLFPESGSPVCFLQSETVFQTKQRHFIMFTWQNSKIFGAILAALARGFLWSAILNDWRSPWGQGTRLFLCQYDFVWWPNLNKQAFRLTSFFQFHFV